MFCTCSQDSLCHSINITCRAYWVSDCGYPINEGACIVKDGICVQKKIDDAVLNLTNMPGYQAHSPNCILRAGDCLTKGSCSSYLLEIQCLKDINDKDCLWNPTSPAQCVDKICSQAKATTKYDTHDKCTAIGNCTVKATIQKQLIRIVLIELHVVLTLYKNNVNQIPKVFIALEIRRIQLIQFVLKNHFATALLKQQNALCQNYFNNTCRVVIVDVDGVPTLK